MLCRASIDGQLLFLLALHTYEILVTFKPAVASVLALDQGSAKMARANQRSCTRCHRDLPTCSCGGVGPARRSARLCRGRDPGGADRISALPDDLLLQILNRLGCAAAAARTSLLSRRWRGLWSGPASPSSSSARCPPGRSTPRLRGSSPRSSSSPEPAAAPRRPGPQLPQVLVRPDCLAV